MFPIGFQPTLQWYVYLKGCFLAIIGSFLVAGSEGRIAESSMSANSSQPRAHKQQGERRLSLWTFARAPCTLQAFQTQGRRGLLLQKRLLTLLLVKGERGDKGLLPTPLNISDKNNDGANLTATCISVSIPLAACQADRATPLSRSGSVQSSDCMEQSHTCLQKKKNVSWTRQKHNCPFPKRKRRFTLSNDEKYTWDGSFSRAPSPHAVGTGLWLQRINCRKWKRSEFVCLAINLPVQ